MDCQEAIEKFRQTLIRAQNASDRAHATLDRLQAAEFQTRREGYRLRGETDKRLQRTIQLSASPPGKPRRGEPPPMPILRVPPLPAPPLPTPRPVTPA